MRTEKRNQFDLLKVSVVLAFYAFSILVSVLLAFYVFRIFFIKNVMFVLFLLHYISIQFRLAGAANKAIVITT